MARRRRYAAIAAGTIAGIVVACAIAWPTIRAYLQAIAVLSQVAGQPAPWVSRALTGAVTIEDLNLRLDGPGGARPVRARLYLPVGRPNAPAMVIFHGVHYLGIDEPRLVGFARAMASCGIRVLTPELPGIKDYHVSEDSVETIGESVNWFAAKTGGPVGVMGLSFSGGLALVADEQPQYRKAFGFVFAVGAQDSMARVTQYYLTGRDARPDGSVEVLKPHEYGPLVIEYEYLEDCVPAADLEPVRAVLRAHLYENKQAEAQAMARLSPSQRAEAEALMDPSLPQTRAKIAHAIELNSYKFPELSPERGLATIATPVYLLHGEADNVIPAAETLWMEKELPHRWLKAALVSPVLSHIDLDGTKPGLMDQWRLLHFFATVMRAAER